MEYSICSTVKILKFEVLFWSLVFSVFSCFEILLRSRELVALLCVLVAICVAVCVMRLFLLVLCVDLWSVIVVFSGNTCFMMNII